MLEHTPYWVRLKLAVISYGLIGTFVLLTAVEKPKRRRRFLLRQGYGGQVALPSQSKFMAATV